MKKLFLFAAIASVTISLAAADASPKDLVEAAARKLADQTNYAWTSTVATPQAAPSGPTQGKTEKGGYTSLTMTRGDNTIEAAFKSGKGALKTSDGWKTLYEAVQDSAQGVNPARMAAMMLLDYQLPAAQALDLAQKAKDIGLTNGVYSGDLSEAGVKQLLNFRRVGPNGTGGPQVRDAAGSVRFWIKDGVISKYEFTLRGAIAIGGMDHQIDRTSTVEIKDVGASKVTVPDEAAKKLAQ